MTTTDEALTEQIARVLNREGWTYEGVHEPGDYDECEDCRRAVDPIAAAVLPIIRKAQADALRDAAGSFGPSGNIHYPGARVRERLRARARRIEKEQNR